MACTGKTGECDDTLGLSCQGITNTMCMLDEKIIFFYRI